MKDTRTILLMAKLWVDMDKPKEKTGCKMAHTQKEQEGQEKVN